LNSTGAPSSNPPEPPYGATVPALLRALAQRHGERDAFVRGDQRITYAGLERRSAEAALGLVALGLGKASRVALLAPNGPQFATYFMAAARIGAVVAPLSTLYQAPELRWVLANADIETLIVADRYLRHDYLARLEEAFPGLPAQKAGAIALPDAPCLRRILVAGVNDRPWAEAIETALGTASACRPEFDETLLRAVEASVTPADMLCMIHTSGSTAHPKGVVHGHGNLIRHSFQMARDFSPMLEGDRMMTQRPWFWVAGLSATFFHSLHMGCTILTGETGSGEEVRRLIESEGATLLSGDEGLFRAVRQSEEFQAGGYGVFRLNMDCAGLAAREGKRWRFLHPERAREIPEPVQVPDDRFARSFGMTEACGAHTSLPRGELLPEGLPRRNGRPVPGVTLKIVDPETGAELPPGAEGELLVRGYCMMQGLYKIERSETLTPDGFYRTGDICTLDERGFLNFVARRGEMLKVHGANVAPPEVELALNQLPEVDSSAVVGMPTDGGDTVLVAAVQLRAGTLLDEARIQAALRRVVSSFKVPKRIVALAADEFPLTGSGKVKKSALAELIRARIAETPASGELS